MAIDCLLVIGVAFAQDDGNRLKDQKRTDDRQLRWILRFCTLRGKQNIDRRKCFDFATLDRLTRFVDDARAILTPRIAASFERSRRPAR